MGPWPFALLLTLLLAACGEIPQPFRHDGPNVAVIPAAARGVVVRPLDEGPRARQIADAMVRRLLEAEVPASTRDGVAGGWIISGTAEDTGATTTLRWQLSTPAGVTLASATQAIPAGTWGRATPRTVDLIAAEVVDKLSPPLHGGTAEVAAPAGSQRPPRVGLLPLSGLPGDGDRALMAAMRRTLERTGLTILDGGGDADFTVRGQVTVTPGRAGEEVLAVAWTVSAREGGDLGSAAQRGPVPKGRLDGPWGSLATEIAAGGADGVAEIIAAQTGAARTGAVKAP